MLTQEQVLEAVRSGRTSDCLDGRDYSRLVDFFPVEHYGVFGFQLKEGADAPTPTPWTRETIVAQMRRDVAFGFEKALGQRGISASLMYSVVKMWLWVLEDELQNFSGYAQYGLPLFKAVAIKYEFTNEIGDDSGEEHKYSTEYEG